VFTAWDWLHRFETQAANLRGRLGLDPLSRARLGKDIAATEVDIAKLMAGMADEEGDDA
jgi:hypothetical protein